MGGKPNEELIEFYNKVYDNLISNEVDQKKINDYAVDEVAFLKGELETVKNKWKTILERRNK